MRDRVIMNFKILTIQYFSKYGIFCTEEIDVEGLDIFAIAQTINYWFKKNKTEIVHAELQ